MQATKAKQNYINHIAIVLDASSSMFHHSSDVVKVADMQIKNLAEQSKVRKVMCCICFSRFDLKDLYRDSNDGNGGLWDVCQECGRHEEKYRAGNHSVE